MAPPVGSYALRSDNVKHPDSPYQLHISPGLEADGARFFGTTSGRLELPSRISPVARHCSTR